MSKIKLEDTTMDVIKKMSDGNPGAIGVVMQIINKGAEIDPQDFMGGMGAVLMLDTCEVYGTDIYVLFNDKCDSDIRKTIMIIRAVQLGLFDRIKFKNMCADQMREINLTSDEWKDLDHSVCKKLPQFQKAA